VLAVARAAGETAPMLILCSIFNPSKVTFELFGQAIPNIPVFIFTASEAADPAGFARAWGAALVLLTLIMLANIGARALLARSRRKLTG
jgi:phosphate transport system permease protein